MEDKISAYVTAADEDVFLHLYDKASELFGDNPLPQGEDTSLVVPELADIPSTKRALIQDIVYEKTHYHIAATADAFLENTTILIDNSERK